MRKLKILLAILAGIAAAVIIGLFRKTSAIGGEWLIPVASGFWEFVRTENECIDDD